MKLTPSELKTHVNICVRRNIPCEYCSKNFKFCEMPEHLKKCPKMKATCECEVYVEMKCREDVSQHLEQDCGKMEETASLDVE